MEIDLGENPISTSEKSERKPKTCNKYGVGLELRYRRIAIKTQFRQMEIDLGENPISTSEKSERKPNN